MSRQKKDFKALNCKLDSTIWDALDNHCEETGISKTFAVEKAVKKYLEDYQEQQNKLKELKNK